MNSKTTKTVVTEQHDCPECGKVTTWTGSSDFTNASGYVFIFCVGCGLADVAGW